MDIAECPPWKGKTNFWTLTSILHPDCIKFQSDHLRDLSTNLLGIFTYTDIFYGIQKESRDELCALWNEGSNVRKILPEEFFKDEGRQAYFIPVAITLKYLSDEVQSHKWHFGLFHTPTNCNFWHVSIRVLDENNNEVSQIETIKNNGKKKIWKTARDFLVSDIISTKELFYKPMPTECYQ